MRDKLSEIIQSAVGGCAKYWADVIADKLIAEGVIVLPCHLGKTVYDISEFVDKHPYPDMYEFSADEITISKCRKTKELIFSMEGMYYTFDEFGKVVFATREEAEKALAERSENGK